MAQQKPLIYSGGILIPWNAANDDFTALSLDVNNRASGTVAGIIAANLVDKAATESVAGAWTFAGGLTATANVTLNGGNLVCSGAEQIAGIANANLLDKSAAEAITGAWDFTGGSIDIAAGASLKIAGAAVSANFNRAKFNELFDGGNATGHTHTGLDSFLSVTLGETVAQYDFVYLDSVSAKVKKADNENLAKSRILGAMNEGGNIDDAKDMIAHQGEVLGPYTQLANLTAGDVVYLDGGANAGKPTGTAPSSGDYRVVLGIVKESDGTDGTFYYTGGETPIQVP